MTRPDWMTWENLKHAFLQPVQVWLLVSLAVAGPAATVGTWMWPPPGSSSGIKRWNAGGGTFETALFTKYSKSPETDGGQQAAFAGANDRSGPSPDPDWSKPRISVYSVPNIPPPHPLPTLRDLGDQAQVRAIEAIEKASSSPMQPWQNLRPALSDTDEPADKDPFLFARVLVATVAKGTAWSLGDRMVWTRVFVRPINFRFAAYTVASTENETVKVSSIEAIDTRKLSAEMSLTIPGLHDSKIGVAPGQESSVKTTSDISAQYERLGIDIMPTFLRIIRESSAGGDVLGNTRVALSITTDPDAIRSGAKVAPEQPDIALVVTEIRETDDAKELTMKVLPLAPLPHCALRAEVWSIYEQRHVNSGNEFYDEARHNVTFVHDVDVKRTVEVVGADDVSPYVWEIQMVPAGEKPNSSWEGRHALQAKVPDGSPRTLIFSDYGRAANLAHWVRTHRGKGLSQYQTNYGEDEAKAGMGLTVVKHTQDDCKENGTQLASILAPK